MDTPAFVFHPKLGILGMSDVARIDKRSEDHKRMKKLLSTHQKKNAKNFREGLEIQSMVVHEKDVENSEELVNLFTEELSGSVLSYNGLKRIQLFFESLKTKKPNDRQLSMLSSISCILMTFEPIASQSGMECFHNILFSVIDSPYMQNLQKILVLLKALTTKWYMNSTLWIPSLFRKNLDRVTKLVFKTDLVFSEKSNGRVSQAAIRFCRNQMGSHILSILKYFRPLAKCKELNPNHKNHGISNFTDALYCAKKLSERGFLERDKIEAHLKGGMHIKGEQLFHEVFNDTLQITENLEEHFSQENYDGGCDKSDISFREKKQKGKGTPMTSSGDSFLFEKRTKESPKNFSTLPLVAHSSLQLQKPTPNGHLTSSSNPNSLINQLASFNIPEISSQSSFGGSGGPGSLAQMNSASSEFNGQGQKSIVSKGQKTEENKEKSKEEAKKKKKKKKPQTTKEELQGKKEESMISQKSKTFIHEKEQNESMELLELLVESEPKKSIKQELITDNSSKKPKSEWYKKTLMNTEQLLGDSFHGDSIHFWYVGSFRLGTQIPGVTQNINFAIDEEKGKDLEWISSKLQAFCKDHASYKSFSDFLIQKDVLKFTYKEKHKKKDMLMVIEIRKDSDGRRRKFYEYLSECLKKQRKLHGVYEELIGSLQTYNYFNYAQLNTYFIFLLLVKACQVQKLLPLYSQASLASATAWSEFAKMDKAKDFRLKVVEGVEVILEKSKEFVIELTRFQNMAVPVNGHLFEKHSRPIKMEDPLDPSHDLGEEVLPTLLHVQHFQEFMRHFNKIVQNASGKKKIPDISEQFFYPPTN